MLPLHVWLPEAHPAAPSPVSALMSGVMLKTAIYGMVRVIYDLIGGVRWEWGLTVLLIGAATSLFGVLFALMQHDLKRLLAYHSVENIGIILIGIGLSMIFIGSGHPVAGVLGLIAGLYHTLNHAVFKALLFLGAGSILNSTGLRNLNEMGGLIRCMPHVALYFLDRRAVDLGAAAAERLRLRMAHVPGGAAGPVSGEWRAAQSRAARRRDAGARRRPHGDVLRQGLRRRFPRPASSRARGTRPRCDAARARRHGLARLRRASCSGCCRSWSLMLDRVSLSLGTRGCPRTRSPRAGCGSRRPRRARELQPARVSARHLHRVRADATARCGGSGTAGCGARRRGTAAIRSRTRACRIRPTPSGSRSARSSRRSI